MTAPPLPEGRFGVILADPPWPFRTYSAKGKGRSAEAHYDTMSIDEIAALPVEGIAAPDAVLLLWITWPILLRAVNDVIPQWGFWYKTSGFVWSKITRWGSDALGLGYWTRKNSEPCLLATRGDPRRLNADVAELIRAPRRQHSRKPEEIFERVERLVDGPYLELFADTEAPPRDGWARWGNARASQRRWPSNSYPAPTQPQA